MQIHPPVHSYSSEREDGDVDRDWLDEEHQIAHRAAKNPTVWVEGVGESERDASHAHEHVREGQVSDEEVGDVVHLAGSADDIEEQVIPKDAHHHNEHTHTQLFSQMYRKVGTASSSPSFTLRAP